MTTTTEYTAYTTTTIKAAQKLTSLKNILVISKVAPLLLDQSGQKITKFTMTEDYGTNVFAQTGIILKGEFWIYGGTTGVDGVSTIAKVSNCTVKMIGTLRVQLETIKPYKFGVGRGTVRNDQTIYLCFSYWMFRSCIKSNDPTGVFKFVGNKSLYTHRSTAMAASNGQCKNDFSLKMII